MQGSGLATVLVDTGRVRQPHRSPGADRRPLTGGTAPHSTGRSSRARDRLDRWPRRSYDPPHAGLALPPLRHPAGGELSLLGLSTVHHLVRDLPPLPPRRSRAASGCAASIRATRRSTATEIRACWTAAVPRTAGPDGGPERQPLRRLALTDADRRPARTFVPVDELGAAASPRRAGRPGPGRSRGRPVPVQRLVAVGRPRGLTRASGPTGLGSGAGHGRRVAT